MDSLYQVYKNELNNFQQRINSELAILLYHGVTDFKSQGIENYSKKHISVNTFMSQTKYLKKNCNTISIEDYIAFRENGESLPPKTVIITFDDGFKNNYTTAAPILDELGLPAVFYVCSGVVDTGFMFWVDILEDCLNLCKKSTISVELDERHCFVIDNQKNKIDALEKIKAYCKSASKERKDQVVEDVQNETEIEASVEQSPNYEKITWNELREMQNAPLFTIGGHSIHHEILSRFSAERLDNEVRHSLDLLELNLKTSICHYSYPEGQTDHYNDQVISILKKNGIICSPTALPGLNPPDMDLFHLRRIMVGFNGLPFPFYSN